MSNLRAYYVSAYDLDGYVAAESRGSAAMMQARQLVDAGWAKSVGEALLALRVVRAPERDIDALSRGRDGALR
jgi:hypothetical protein